MLNRRDFLVTGAAAFASQSLLTTETPAADKSGDFKLKYILATPMYGYAPLAEIVPEAAKVGATHIDIWPKVHGNQREQLDEMGEAAFAKLLADHKVKLGCITQYKLGPFGLQGEMKLAQRLGCQLLVCGGRGPKDAKGKELKAAVGKFIEELKPHLAVAEETGTTIAIENHGNNLIDSPDSLKWLAELRPSKHLGIAFAPYHLPQDEKLQADLIRTLGNSIRMFYAWEHGMGCHVKLPKEQELMQMPGRGELDFAPLLAALRDVKYDGWSEIFMHPVPRGVPILNSSEKITAEINRSRKYLSERLGSI
jgi:sugar phosphate isomerase/epimerase